MMMSHLTVKFWSMNQVMSQIRQVNQSYVKSSQNQLAKWVGSQCMAILEDWGSASELPAFSTCIHE